MIIYNSLFFLRKFSFHFPPVDMLDLQNFLLFRSTDIRPKINELRDTLDVKVFRNASVFWASGRRTVRCSEQREVVICENEGKWGGNSPVSSDDIALTP